MASNCKSIIGMSVDVCKPSLGGIKRVWLADYAADAIPANGIETETEVIKNFKDGIVWHPFVFRKNTGSMTSTANFSDEGGTYISTELSLSFSRMETEKRLSMNTLLLGEVMAVVLDANGEYWFLGKDNPVTATAGSGETGTAKSDANRYALTITDESLYYPHNVDKTLGEGLPTTEE